MPRPPLRIARRLQRAAVADGARCLYRQGSAAADGVAVVEAGGGDLHAALAADAAGVPYRPAGLHGQRACAGDAAAVVQRGGVEAGRALAAQLARIADAACGLHRQQAGGGEAAAVLQPAIGGHDGLPH